METNCEQWKLIGSLETKTTTKMETNSEYVNWFD